MGQRNKDFPIGHAGGGAIAKGHGVGAVRQADVVEHQLHFVFRDDLANRVLDLAEVPLGLLDSRAGRCPHRPRWTSQRPRRSGANYSEHLLMLILL